MEANNTPQTIDFSELVLQNEAALEEGKLEFNFEDLKNQTFEDDKPVLEEEKTTGEEDDNKIDPPAPKVEEPKVEPAAPAAAPVSEPTSYSNAAKKLLEKGDWTDVIIENEDGTEVKLSEVDNLDEATFLSILEEQRKASKDQLKEDYVPIKGIDENKKRIINIVANGGDLKEIFDNEAQLKKPYENADLTNLNTQQNILYSFYITQQGLAEDEARELVLKATKDLTVDKKAEAIVTQSQANYEESLKKLEADVLKQKADEQAAIKEYRKNLSTLFKEDGIEDNLSKTFIDAATKEKDGQIFIDSVYEKLMKDPAQAKDLIFFMLEKDKFLTKVGASVKRDTNINTLRKVKLVQDTGKTTNVVKEEEEKGNSVFSNIVLPD